MSEQTEILQIFFQETDELLKLAERSLISLESSPESTSNIEGFFRSLHTLKSSAAMMGFSTISEYAHFLEGLLDRLRSRRLVVTKNLITFPLESVDLLRTMVDGACRGEPEEHGVALNKSRELARRYLGLEVEESVREEPLRHAGETACGESEASARYHSIGLRLREDILYSGRDSPARVVGSFRAGGNRPAPSRSIAPSGH